MLTHNMNDIQIEKVKRFVNDKVMSDAVQDAVIKEILSKSNGDVNILASRFIAINEVKEAWKSLEIYTQDPGEENNGKPQIGM